MTCAPRPIALTLLCAFAVASAIAAPETSPAPSPAPSPSASPAPAKTKAESQNQGEIIELVRIGDMDGLRELIKKNPSEANFVGPGGMTPLGIGLSRRNFPLVDTLLKAGADPNMPFGALQMHPIQGAAASGNLDAVKALLAKGVDVNKPDINGGTALHAATLYGREDIIKLLLEKGADVNAAFTAGPNKGATPLHYAARSKNVVLVMAVATSKADWSIKWNGKTPAELADAVGAKEVAEYIRGKEKPAAAPAASPKP